ncbi:MULTISPECIES: succinylglutamate desuccinylase [Marinomonas]|uniref:Succinylglutamate desuccinylase n=1 Tax=Marinomonas arctica TaxID=383750 RepID=A0A7H1J8S7_9GAMM|nr:MULTISPECIES: succinylglutamate desuccinylase [Marinomonas]MCS7487264.1 succinylglutamate desuccinylase [Marinomonas sp. BSi20414]QNT06893.1 succinylglutamate desuccinylase [Marinomonas arctica]GGN33902.1 succinylglutamate desuccinylase [Marinomonas arctica]
MTILNHDFLALTLANPNAMAPFQLTFPSGTGVVEETGILRLEPTQTSRVSVVLSAGIHGNETGPMELINQLVRDILAGKLTLGVRLLVIIGHPVAANAATRFCDVNLNRLFSGAWRNYAGIEVQRAERLEMAVNDFYALSSTDSEHIRLHYDLHTAIRGSMHEKFVVHPFVENAHYSKQQLAFFAASEIEAVLLSHQPTTTFSYYSHSVHGAHAFTVELGKVYPFGQNDLSCFAALEKNLRQLLEKGSLAESSLSSLCIFNVLDALVKDDDSYELNIDQDVKNFTQFTEGYPLAQSKKSVYRVKQTGDAIVFPNTNLPVGQRAGLVVRAISVDALSLI